MTEKTIRSDWVDAKPVALTVYVIRAMAAYKPAITIWKESPMQQQEPWRRQGKRRGRR